MGKALIIAEKPSVANDIAKALGGFTKHGDYFESDHYVLSSAVGHLLELCVPEKYEVKRGKWTFANLPVIPPHFDLKPIEKNEARLKVLKRLLKRQDVDALINACDAGREGELIFRYIVQHAKVDKPIRRLWLQSMTPAAIRHGFERLREDQEMRPLASAAVCRSESDWLVGINGTRAMTAFNSKAGGFQLTTVGRVQTPTLTILVDREKVIRKFEPQDYWEVHATFGAVAGDYPGRWLDEQFQRSKDGEGTHQRAERIWDSDKAESIRAKCEGKPGIVEETSKDSTQASPVLYDLTSLQRDANNRLGLSATRTLSIAQALYEKHKVITYPRTDSRALPEDYIDTVKQTLRMLEDVSVEGSGSYETFARQVLENDWVKPSKRIFNNAKISDHFAIIPTTQAPKKLNDIEAKLYDLITKRFLAVFYPPAEFKVTTRITRVEEEAFKTEGKVLVKPGWLAVYRRSANAEDNGNLVPVTPGETVATRAIEVQASQTKPPPRYSEATLLSAMEGAGKLVDDEELRAAMSAKGLGTPATRASIIEGLIREKYVVRQAKELQPTPKAFSIVTLLRGLGIHDLCSPELTGNWEYKLKEMEKGNLQRDEFMGEIADMTRRLVDSTKSYESDTVPGEFEELKVPCPKCGGVVKETYRNFQCNNKDCDFYVSKNLGGRLFDVSEVEKLITEKTIGPLQDFRSKMGRPFAAILKFNDEFKVEFDFGRDDQNGGNGFEPVDFSGKESVGTCPKCGGSVYENGMSYVCDKSVGPEKSCTFRSGVVILQQAVERPQMVKLLETGKTDLLPRFISKKGRPFKAFLVLGNDGKVGFEFEPRTGKGAKKAGSKEAEAKPDFTGQEPVGQCPKCGGKIFESETEYLCERSQAESKRCTFKAAKILCQHPIDRVVMAKVLKEGRSELIPDFISRWGKPFKAYLILEGKSKGKVGFEFPEEEEESAPAAPEPEA